MDVEKPAAKVIDALRGTPMLLFVVILNVLVLSMITYLLKVRGEAIAVERSLLIELISDCLEDKGKNGGAIDKQNFKLKLKGLQ